MNRKTPKTIGVLGGMGPEATALFFQRIVDLTPAKVDQNHIPVLIYNNPQIPDRTKGILKQGEDPLPELLRSLALLEQAGADFVCIPCNSAHFYYEQMASQCKVEILNLIQEVLEACLQENGDYETVGLLATSGTIQSQLYQQAFQKRGIAVIVPDAWELKDLQSVIYRIKGKTKNVVAVEAFARQLVKKGAQAVILGCTELSLVQSELSLAVPIFDSLEVLAKRAVQLALTR
ncbi:MAG: aspartate/glutamate racemase family protein [bacterium]